VKTTRVDQLIGHTPLIRLNTISDKAMGMNIYGKLEALNPGYSVKDRSALQLIEQAKIDYDLQPGATIVESTSGNMGHALAMLCAINHFKFICVLDPKTPRSNVTLVRAFGGRVAMVDSPDETGSFQKKRIEMARTIAKKTPNCINLDQYNNPAAIQAHYLTTGPEIYEQTEGKIDALIGSASTGSHLSGIAKYLKEKNKNIHIIGVEPVGSVVFGGQFKPFLQNGTGLSFKPGNILDKYVDEVIRVSDRDAFAACRQLARTEGLLLGGSSGSVVAAASKYIEHLTKPSIIVVVLPDGGLKYLETIYDDQWLQDHDMSDLVTHEGNFVMEESHMNTPNVASRSTSDTPGIKMQIQSDALDAKYSKNSVSADI
jgi:2,3-diaminopropionate biosynthesis protein SbnA